MTGRAPRMERTAAAGRGPGYRRRLGIGLLVAGLAVLAVTGAACSRPDPVVQLWSDRAELAAYVDAFNAAQGPVRVELTYVAQPAALLAGGAAAPDLILAAGLASPELHRLLAPIGRLLAGHLATEDYFPALLASGAAGGRQITLPFSFNLPVAVFARAVTPPEIDQFLLPVEELRRLGAEFDEPAQRPDGAHAADAPGQVTAQWAGRIGFSPLWNMEVVHLLARTRGGGFAATAEGTVAIDREQLAATMAAVHDWLRSAPGGVAGQHQFIDTFFHRPPYQLVLAGRIRLYVSDIASFARLPEQKRELLDFRWLSVDGVIPVLDAHRSFAVPAAADNPAGAAVFLRWITRPEIQAHLLEAPTFGWLRNFGLVGGFPALRAVSERVLPRSHAFLIGRLPDANLLRMPDPPPVDWALAKEQVISPWLRGAATAGATPPPGQPGLAEAIERWRRSTRMPWRPKPSPSVRFRPSPLTLRRLSQLDRRPG